MSRTEIGLLETISPQLLDRLRAATPRVAARATDRLAAAHDASHYLLTPKVIVTPDDADSVARVLAASRAAGVPVTFRSGGTSLSGQASTTGVLVDTRKAFQHIQVLDDGARVRCGPGATVRAVNARLLRHTRKLGPDPASEIACTIGGVVANNSSGMACGLEGNTYRTLDSMVLVLPSGSIIDTAAADADAVLQRDEPGIHAGLGLLRDRIRGDAGSVETIQRLHSIKNTMGYGLNSFLDYDRPVDILEHLVIGSEGTLAFVAETTFRTVPTKPHAVNELLVFPDLAGATAALPELVAVGFATIELLDATSLRVGQRDPEAPPALQALDITTQAALLVEFQEESAIALDAQVAAAADVLAGLPLTEPAVLSGDPVRRAQLWHIRKGLYTLVAGARPSGTTALLEDIAVPVDRLYETCARLTELFAHHGYEDSVIFGHAKDGNIHFMLNERFDQPELLARYEAFTADMVELVLSQGGTLKAEHGTGRVMAPFVRRQYGDELYEVMREVKALIDPDSLLNPGVLLNEDPDAHITGLKTSPTVESEVDRCVECGYCEPVCPSRDLTVTPRERIVLRREMARAESAGDAALLKTLREEYDYDGVQTCAVDGMCQTACPVLINTGDLVRRLRAEQAKPLEQAGWKVAASHWDTTSRLGGVALGVARALPSTLPGIATTIGRALIGADTVPQYSAELPGGGSRRPRLTHSDPAAVYFSSCTTTMFGPGAADDPGVSRAFLRLCALAGVTLSTPDDLPSLCCGTPWKSKGLTDGYRVMKDRVVASLRAATFGGRLPVVCDASSCSEGLEVLLETAQEAGIRVIDAVAFTDEILLPNLPSARVKIPTLTLHPTCSSTRLGVNDALLRVASAAAETVNVPEDWSCCAFAGDRGMLHPELTASATAREADGVRTLAASAHASLNRTCELGMTRATGNAYRHVLEVLEATMSV